MIIIGDVHGCFKTLKALIKKLPQNETICFVGDLIDRGDNSVDVVQYVIDNGHLCVRGNHEDMLLDYNSGVDPATFIMNGGQKTLSEYDLHPTVLDQQLKWMLALPYYLEFPEIKNEDGRYLVVSHSHICNVWKSIRRDKKLGNLPSSVTFDVTFDYIIWNRDTILKNIPEIYNVIGHTPELVPKIKKTYANIDTGCYYKKRGYGTLTALRFPEMIVYSQENVE